MGRKNLILKSIFSEIFDRENMSLYNDFLNIDEELNINDSEYIAAKKFYAEKLKFIQQDLKVISLAEELIIQQRCHTKISDEMKIFFVNDFLYARTPFFRSYKSPKDIRVPVLSVGKLPSIRINVLLKDKKIMKMARDKLSLVIQKEIDKTRNELNLYMKKHINENFNYEKI